MNDTLFIGGPWDGKRRELNSPILEQKVLTLTLGEPLEDIYRIQEYASSDGKSRIKVAVHESIRNVTLHLIQNYGK